MEQTRLSKADELMINLVFLWVLLMKSWNKGVMVLTVWHQDYCKTKHLCLDAYSFHTWYLHLICLWRVFMLQIFFDFGRLHFARLKVSSQQCCVFFVILQNGVFILTCTVIRKSVQGSCQNGRWCRCNIILVAKDQKKAYVFHSAAT